METEIRIDTEWCDIGAMWTCPRCGERNSWQIDSEHEELKCDECGAKYTGHLRYWIEPVAEKEAA